jgi:predicted metal-binding membrane protein
MLRHPELGAAAAVAAAWALLIAAAVGAARSGGWLAWINSMPAMVTADQAGGTFTAALASLAAWSRAAGALPGWALMTIAMMGPAALAAVRHTGLNSLRWRRRRAMAEFSAGYLAVWTAFGLVALTTAETARAVPGAQALALALIVAAAWQLSPIKRRCLRACHHVVPLPPRGWRAEAAAVRFGLRHGLSCLGSCWCLMLVMIAAPGSQVLWTAVLTGIVTSEKVSGRPRHAVRLGAAVLAIAAVATACVGNLLR